MKRLITLVVITAIVVSCSKPNTSTTNLLSTVTFDANGSHYEIDSSLADNSLQGSVLEKHAGEYELTAQNGIIGDVPSEVYLHINLGSTIVTPNTYNLTWLNGNYISETRLNGTVYYGLKTGDYVTTTVTKIHDGVYADGTFSAQLSGQTMAITNGQFKNVKILQ